MTAPLTAAGLREMAEKAIDEPGRRVLTSALYDAIPRIEAALKLAELLAAREAEIVADPFAPLDRGPFGTRVLGLLAAFRATGEAR